MTRSRQREHAFLMLFRTDFHKLSDMKEQDELYLGEVDELEKIKPEELEYISKRVEAAREKFPDIDKMINEKAVGWNITRIGVAELTIIRLALYEMLYDDTIPDGVAINEAVELAKKFCGEDTPAFVNGILSKFVEKKTESEEVKEVKEESKENQEI